jgi:uncharacterized protein (DUF1015 family)
VPRFEPFSALRYAPALPLDRVAAPPYDVLDDRDISRLRTLDPCNIVHVDVPLESDGPTRYRAAADLLGTWVADGIFVSDPRPSFTVYRMEFTDATGTARSTVGILGALEVVDEGAGGVLPHERTTPKAKSDRLDLTRATSANLSPVWGLSLATGLTALLREPGTEAGRCVDEQGVVHTVERVDDPERIEAISRLVGSSDVLIADGHHRYAISRTYRDEVRAARGGDAGDAELTLTYVAELIEEQLSIDAIHRLYSACAAHELLDVLSRSFDLEPAGMVEPAHIAEMQRRGALCLVDGNGFGTWLTPRPDAFAGVRDLDGALLEHALRDTDIDVSYQHGLEHVLHMLQSGGAQAAVLIRPTGIDEIRRTAAERLLMPPKSTFFTPKLRTGLVVRPLR